MSTSSKHPWVLFIHNSKVLSGCEAYRMWLPCEELGKHGYTADYAHHSQLPAMAEQARRQNRAGPGVYDLYVVPRGGIGQGRGLDMLRAAGKKFIFEVDDDFTNEHREVVGPAEYEAIWTFAREAADGFTVSTPYLAERMRARVPKHKPIFVLPNSLRWEMWQGIPKAERLTLGLTGSATHGKDWIVLRDVLPRLLAEFPQIDLQVAGYVPDFLADLPERFEGRVTTSRGWLDYRQYPGLVGRAQIVLCPVDPGDPFNWSKSGIKAVEGLAAGAAVVASDVNIYRPVIGDNKRGLLADFRPESWYEAIKALIVDPHLRQGLSERGRRFVREHHSIDLNWHLWLKAYQEIAGR